MSLPSIPEPKIKLPTITLNQCCHKVIVLQNEEYLFFMNNQKKKYMCMNCGEYFTIQPMFSQYNSVKKEKE